MGLSNHGHKGLVGTMQRWSIDMILKHSVTDYPCSIDPEKTPFIDFIFGYMYIQGRPYSAVVQRCTMLVG